MIVALLVFALYSWIAAVIVAGILKPMLRKTLAFDDNWKFNTRCTNGETIGLLELENDENSDWEASSESSSGSESGSSQEEDEEEEEKEKEEEEKEVPEQAETQEEEKEDTGSGLLSMLKPALTRRSGSLNLLVQTPVDDVPYEVLDGTKKDAATSPAQSDTNEEEEVTPVPKSSTWKSVRGQGVTAFLEEICDGLSNENAAIAKHAVLDAMRIYADNICGTVRDILHKKPTFDVACIDETLRARLYAPYMWLTSDYWNAPTETEWARSIHAWVSWDNVR